MAIEIEGNFFRYKKGKPYGASVTIQFESTSERSYILFHGFRPVNNSVVLRSVPDNPWNQNILGAQIQPAIKTLPLSTASAIAEIQRLWERTT